MNRDGCVSAWVTGLFLVAAVGECTTSAAGQQLCGRWVVCRWGFRPIHAPWQALKPGRGWVALVSPPPWAPVLRGRAGGTALQGSLQDRGASLTSPAHPVQTCTSGSQASLRAAPPRSDSECLWLPGLQQH